jgi:hypothetical protein
MNNQKESPTRVRRFSRLTCLIVLPTLFASQIAKAQDFVLTDNNSTIGLNLANGGFGPAGLTSWLVDGVNQLNRQSFFYRIGGGQEYTLDNITASPVVNFSGDNIEVTYANSSFGIKLSYTLNGAALGTGRSGATLGVNVINYQATTLDFHLFQYSDFDLGGTAGSESVNFLKALGKFNRAVQTTGSLGMTNTFLGTAISSPTPLVEANTFNSTLLSLTDLSQTAFNSLSTNAGPGNVTYAIQYDLLLDAGESFALSESFNMAVPEPTSATLIAIAGACLAFGGIRRKKSSLATTTKSDQSTKPQYLCSKSHTSP